MENMKRFACLLLLAIPLFVLASCDMSKGNSTKENDQNISTKVYVAEDGKASFIIKNESKEEIALVMSSGQQLEFQLLNEAKEIAFTYSANKSFAQGLHEKKLQSEEEWAIPLELETELAGVSAGSYKLVVWSTAEGLQDLKVKTAYEWDGTDTTEVPGKAVVVTQEVTFIGLEGTDTVKVKNLEGVTETMLISEEATVLFVNLDAGTQLLVDYIVANSEKVIQWGSLAE